MPVLLQTVVNAFSNRDVGKTRDGQAPMTIVTNITFLYVKWPLNIYNPLRESTSVLHCYDCVVGSAVTDFQLHFLCGIMVIGLQ